MSSIAWGGLIKQFGQQPVDKMLRDDYLYCDLAETCHHLRNALKVYDTKWKSIIPSLALWCHIKNLEFDFGGEDKYILSRFGHKVGMEEKMSIVQKALKVKRAVNLKVYDYWSEESKQYFLAEDHYCKIPGPPARYDGKLIDTTDGSTTIYIDLPVFCVMTKHLWRIIDAFATIRKFSTDIYDLLNGPLTTKDELSVVDISRRHESNGGTFLDILVDMKTAMEPKYNPLIRKEQKDILEWVWARHTKREMLNFRICHDQEEFPFSYYMEYSATVRELLKSKVDALERDPATKFMVEFYPKFISSPFDMEEELKSAYPNICDALPRDSAVKLHQMCSNALKEFNIVEEQFRKMDRFVNTMEELFHDTVTDEDLSKSVDSDIKHLKSLGLDSNKAENIEGLQTSLKDSFIMKRWFQDLSVDYAVLGILLYIEGAALTDDKRKEFIEMRVKNCMEVKRNYLYEIWCESCYGTKEYRDLVDPARVLSWVDDETEVPKCEWHDEVPSRLKLAEDELKRHSDRFTKLPVWPSLAAPV